MQGAAIPTSVSVVKYKLYAQWHLHLKEEFFFMFEESTLLHGDDVWLLTRWFEMHTYLPHNVVARFPICTQHRLQLYIFTVFICWCTGSCAFNMQYLFSHFFNAKVRHHLTLLAFMHASTVTLEIKIVISHLPETYRHEELIKSYHCIVFCCCYHNGVVLPQHKIHHSSFLHETKRRWSLNRNKLKLLRSVNEWEGER